MARLLLFLLSLSERKVFLLILIVKAMIDTGKMILDFMNERRLSKTELGAMIGREGISILQYTRNKGIQTEILLNLCNATKHNFFQDIANELPKDYTVNKDIFAEKDALIMQLQEEVKVLKIQNEVLLRVKGS